MVRCSEKNLLCKDVDLVSFCQMHGRIRLHFRLCESRKQTHLKSVIKMHIILKAMEVRGSSQYDWRWLGSDPGIVRHRV